MCWSGEASAVLAAVGLGSTVYAAYKKEPAVLWMTLGYFSLMELLQAFTYSVIDQCSLPSNQIATLLGYLHIAFQPFFINAISMYFIPERIAKKVAPFAYTVCFFSAVFMIIQLYPFEWTGICDIERAMCGRDLCSVSGDWHIAWDLPVNSIGNGWPQNGFPTYAIAGFLVPVLYGSWRMTAYHYVMGPSLAIFLTGDVNEWPAVWCLLSIGLLLIVVKTPVRQFLHVKRWVFWGEDIAHEGKVK